jgi:A/G-specific adenine glycosylase
MGQSMSESKKKGKGVIFDIEGFRASILSWYWQKGRDLPWRVKGGVPANPYAVWLSEIIMQQTTIPMGTPYFLKFMSLWPTLADLADAPLEDVLKHWAGLGYYARARNLHACARHLIEHQGGRFPETLEGLKTLPGIGPYTASAIHAICYQKPATVVDGNVERVMARIFAVMDPVPQSKKILIQHAEQLSAGRTDHPGDYAQGMMDLGAMICTPRSPKCGLCPVSGHCLARQQNIADQLPVKFPKIPKPKKQGYVYWIKNKHSQILYETRPPKGLFGGMAGLPTSEWVSDNDSMTHPDFLDGQKIIVYPGRHVRHVFTHFELTLIPCDVVWKGRIPSHLKSVDRQNVAELGLATLFQKVTKVMT